MAFRYLITADQSAQYRSNAQTPSLTISNFSLNEINERENKTVYMTTNDKYLRATNTKYRGRFGRNVFILHGNV